MLFYLVHVNLGIVSEESPRDPVSSVRRCVLKVLISGG